MSSNSDKIQDKKKVEQEKKLELWHDEMKNFHEKVLKYEEGKFEWKNKLTRYIAFCIDGGLLNS